MADQLSQTMSMMFPMLLMKSDGDSTSKIVNSIIVLVLTTIVSVLSKHISTFNIQDITKYISNRRSKVYLIKCSITYKNNTLYATNVSLPFKAVMHYLYEKIVSDHETKVKYNIVEHSLYVSCNPVKFVSFTSNGATYNVSENIKINLCHISSRSEKDDYVYDTYEMRLSSNNNDIKDVVAFIKVALEAYDAYQSRHLDNLKIYTLSDFDKDHPNYHEMDFKTTKSFDNMFFEEKEALLNRLNMFQHTNKSEYERLGIPYTFGLMFHGQPGTGKTSAIKALAQQTKRHIILIPVKKINTVEKLKKLFLTERINDLKIPMDRRLYVFEEIDCSQWQNIVLSRQFKKPEPTPGVPGSKVDELAECIKSMVCATPVDDHGKPAPPLEFDLCLGDLLEVLDGMVEMPGRMMVMTSNHPERLDPALLRPGRIDMQLEFKKLTRANVEDMYRLWFNKGIPCHVASRIKDYRFSQAEIGNLFSTHNMEHIHCMLNAP